MSRSLLYHLGTDHLFGTYVTNYIAGAVCLIGAVILYFLRGPYKIKCCNGIFMSESYKIFQIYISQGCALIFGGIVHQYFPHTNEYEGTPVGWHIFWRLSLLFISIATAFAAFLANIIYITDPKIETLKTITIKQFGVVRFWAVLIIVTAVFVWSNFMHVFIEPSLSFIGFVYGIVLFILVIVIIVKMCKIKQVSLPYIFYIIGALLQIIGGLIQASNTAECGVEDPIDCPFDESCNHNCVFHIIQMFGLILWLPAVLLEKPIYDDVGDTKVENQSDEESQDKPEKEDIDQQEITTLVPKD